MTNCRTGLGVRFVQCRETCRDRDGRPYPEYEPGWQCLNKKAGKVILWRGTKREIILNTSPCPSCCRQIHCTTTATSLLVYWQGSKLGALLDCLLRTRPTSLISKQGTGRSPHICLQFLPLSLDDGKHRLIPDKLLEEQVRDVVKGIANSQTDRKSVVPPRRCCRRSGNVSSKV